MASKVQIISGAFVRIGKGTVNSPETDNRIFAAASSVYDLLYPDILTAHPWRFAMTFVQLNKLNEETGLARFSDVFQLPSDIVLLNRTERTTLFEIFGEKLYTNANEINLMYNRIVPESEFPFYFTNLMILQLTGQIAMTVTQLPQVAEFWIELAQKELAVAKSKDSRIQPNVVIQNNAIWNSHFTNNTGNLRFV